MRTEGMLDGLPPLAHLLRMLVESALHDFEYVLVLPPRDPSLLASGAAMFDSAMPANIGQVAVQDQSVLLGCK